MPGAKIRDFTDLMVWQKAHAMALKIYKITKTFPADERFGIVSQMRRSAVSVAANLAEGFRREGKKGKTFFYNLSQTSLEELRYYFILCRDLEYIKDVTELMKESEEIARMLRGLINSIRGSD